MPPPNPTGVDQLQKGLRLGECLQTLVLLHVPPDLPPLLGMGRGRIAHPPHMQRSALGRKGKTKPRLMFPPAGSVFWGLFLSASPLSRCFLRGMSTGGPTMAKHPPFPDSSMGNSVAVERCWERSPCSGAVPPSFSSFFLSLLIGMLLFLSLYVSSFGEEVGGGPEAVRSAFSLSTSPRRGGTSGGCGPLLCSLRGPPRPPSPPKPSPSAQCHVSKQIQPGKGWPGGLAEEERLLLQQIAAGGNPFPSYPPDGSTHTHPPPPPPPPLFFFSFLFVFFFFFFAFNPFFFHADGAGGWWGAEPMGCIAWV